MQTIEQLLRDKRQLAKLGTVSAVTGEPLGNLLSRLADRNTSLLFQRPPEARLYCVTQSDSGYGEYPKSILDLSKTRLLTEKHKPRRGTTYVEASYFDYLVLMANDYTDLLDGDVTLPINYFSQATALKKNEPKLGFITATQYFREKIPNSIFSQQIKAKFASYLENGEWPGIFNIKCLQVKSEELLIPRQALLDLIGNKEKLNNPFPPELIEHLQPWKSNFLRAMNIAAYELYSHCTQTEIKNHNINSSSIKKAIVSNLSLKTGSDAKISSAATLLHHGHDQLKAKNYLRERDIKLYPGCFSYKLIYLNEKCKEYCSDYSQDINSSPHTATSIERDLTDEKVIPKNTVRRLAGEINPDYGKIDSSTFHVDLT
nr:hypothetical protein [uncultured Halomonas sp.]